MKDSPLDLSPDEFRRLGHRAVELIAEQLEALPGDPARRWPTEALREEILAQPLPTLPGAADRILEDFQARVAPHLMGNNSPRFFAWVNSTAAPFGVLADLMASAANPSVAGGDHVPTYIEHTVLRWLKEMIGWPAGAGAVLTSGGSAATLIALAVMRQRASAGRVRSEGVSAERGRLMLYTSDQGHSCIQKAVELLGLGNQSLRCVASDAQRRMDVKLLEEAVRRDREQGLRPVAVIASAGTVNTGAVDPMNDLADLCEEHGLWLHVDGAYGAAAALSPELAPLLAGIERADSLALDPHKWLYQPVACGCVLVKDRALMREALSVVPPYLVDDSPLPWFSEYSSEQTRGFRALKLWFVLQQVGSLELARSIEENVASARALGELVDAHPELERMSAGPLSILCFRYRPRALDAQHDLSSLNRRLAQILQRKGRVFLTTTELGGETVLRACIVNFRTDLSDLNELVDEVIEAGRSAASARPGS